MYFWKLKRQNYYYHDCQEFLNFKLYKYFLPSILLIAANSESIFYIVEILFLSKFQEKVVYNNLFIVSWIKLVKDLLGFLIR